MAYASPMHVVVYVYNVQNNTRALLIDIILQEHTIPHVAYKRMYSFVTFYDVITQHVKTLVVDNQIEITKSHMPMFISNLSYVLAI